MGHFKLASLFALTLGASLMLGAVPRDARAVVCGDLKLKDECVVPLDVKKNAVRAKHRRDEAGTRFVSEPDIPMDFDVPKVYASVKLKAPAAGTVIVNASLVIEALENTVNNGLRDGHGIVRCALTKGGNTIPTDNPNQFSGSVDWKNGIVFSTMAITRGFRLTRKKSMTIALVCAQSSGTSLSRGLLKLRAPSISAAYYSNKT